MLVEPHTAATTPAARIAGCRRERHLVRSSRQLSTLTRLDEPFGSIPGDTHARNRLLIFDTGSTA